MVVVRALNGEDLLISEEDAGMASDPKHLARLLESIQIYWVCEQVGFGELAR